MVSLRKTLTTAHRALESAGIAHALIGGFALAHFGIHRATQDVDFIADGDRKAEIIAALTQADIQSLIEHNPSLGWTRVKHYADQFNEWSTIEKLRLTVSKKQ